MGIKVIDNVPENKNKLTQRDAIRKDFKEAFDKDIEKYEFVDDIYNYKALKTNIKNTMWLWFQKEIYRKAYLEVKKTIDIEGRYVQSCSYYFKKYIKLSERKMPDRTHVYCEWDVRALKNMQEILINDIVNNNQ